MTSPMMTVAQPRSLSLADLEAHDPQAEPAAADGNRRFLCPLPGPCTDKQSPSAGHRTLSANVVHSGAWYCFRCGEKGLLREWQTQPNDKRPALTSGQREQQRRGNQLRRFTEPPVKKGAPEVADESWRNFLKKLRPLKGTPGENYLSVRGLSLAVCLAAGVQFTAFWYNRPAVVFKIQGQDGTTVAAQGRFVDGRNGPKAMSAGMISAGIFATPSALESSVVAIVEAPIDALSLASVGLPAVAVCGSRLAPKWLLQRCFNKTVLPAFDADEVGDTCAASLRNALNQYGPVVVKRLRPVGGKDWNEVLCVQGVDALRAAVSPWHDLMYSGPPPSESLSLSEARNQYGPWILAELGRNGASPEAREAFAAAWELEPG